MIEVTVTLKGVEELEAEIAALIAKAASGEIQPEAEPPCDCVGCTPHLGPEIPCTGKRSDGTGEKL